MNDEPDLQPFVVPFQAQWSDMDQNGHMRTTAYLAVAEDSRMQFFASRGFPMSEFVRRDLAPVVQRDELRHQAELRLLETATIELRVAGLSQDGARFSMRNTFVRSDGKVSCNITTTGGWLGLRERRLVAPPKDLVSALRGLEKTADYENLSSPVNRVQAV